MSDYPIYFVFMSIEDSEEQLLVTIKGGEQIKIPRPARHINEPDDVYTFRIDQAINIALGKHYSSRPRGLQTPPAQKDASALEIIKERLHIANTSGLLDRLLHKPIGRQHHNKYAFGSKVKK